MSEITTNTCKCTDVLPQHLISTNDGTEHIVCGNVVTEKVDES